MSYVKTNWRQMEVCCDELVRYQQRLSRYGEEIDDVRRQLSLQIKLQSNVDENLRSLSSRMDKLESGLGKTRTVLGNAAAEYKNTEKRLCGEGFLRPFIDWRRILLALGGSGSVLGFTGGGTDSDNGGWPSGAVFSTAGTISGSLFGIYASSTAEGTLLGYKVTPIKKFTWDLDKDDAKIEYGLKADGWLAGVEVSGEYGYASGSISGKVGKGAVQGTVGLSLYDDGVFSPSLQAKLKGEVNALEGEANVQLGTAEYNVHGKATGDVLHAGAEASGGVGVITYEDSEGNTHTAFGVEGKVGAEAYAVTGKVSGGFTIAGIKFDFGLEGKAGGAGVSAGGRVTTNGVSGEIGGGLGLGGGLKFSVDWSGVDFSQLKFW